MTGAGTTFVTAAGAVAVRVGTAAGEQGGAVPLALVGGALLIVALAVRQVIRLALLTAAAGLVAVVVAAWHAGLFTG